MSPSASSGLPGSVHGSTLPRALRLGLLPYLALLQVGFAMPPLLPGARCALTAPFHPCRRPVTGAWAVCFLLHFPWARAPQALPGTLSAGARTFLHPARSGTAAARPTPARTIRPQGPKSNARCGGVAQRRLSRRPARRSNLRLRLGAARGERRPRCVWRP
jgi:hypothetical protein